MDRGDELVMHIVANALGAIGRSVHWDNGSLPCGDWVGIYCDISARVVVGITTQGFGLNDTLPEVHYLAALRFLDLRGNRITDPLPQVPFPKLKTLLLDRNEFTVVPSNFSAIMSKLATLTVNNDAVLQDWKLPSVALCCSQLPVLQACNASIMLSIFLRDGNVFPGLRQVSLPNNRLVGPVPTTVC
jgi:hypothetical protein